MKPVVPLSRHGNIKGKKEYKEGKKIYIEFNVV